MNRKEAVFNQSLNEWVSDKLPWDARIIRDFKNYSMNEDMPLLMLGKDVKGYIEIDIDNSKKLDLIFFYRKPEERENFYEYATTYEIKTICDGISDFKILYMFVLGGRLDNDYAVLYEYFKDYLFPKYHFGR